jgi:hypothetical protein
VIEPLTDLDEIQRGRSRSGPAGTLSRQRSSTERAETPILRLRPEISSFGPAGIVAYRQHWRFLLLPSHCCAVFQVRLGLPYDGGLS